MFCSDRACPQALQTAYNCNAADDGCAKRLVGWDQLDAIIARYGSSLGKKHKTASQRKGFGAGAVVQSGSQKYALVEADPNWQSILVEEFATRFYAVPDELEVNEREGYQQWADDNELGPVDSGMLPVDDHKILEKCF